VTGSQQLLPGLLLAALLGAVVGRWLMPLPLYRALEELASDQQMHTSKQQLNADLLEREI
jgi:H+/Cl- antiporter ClcA